MILQDFIYKNKLTKIKVAKKLGITNTYLSAVFGGRCQPSIKLAIAIIRYTKGEVTPEDIYPDLYDALKKTKHGKEMTEKEQKG